MQTTNWKIVEILLSPLKLFSYHRNTNSKTAFLIRYWQNISIANFKQSKFNSSCWKPVTIRYPLPCINNNDRKTYFYPPTVIWILSFEIKVFTLGKIGGISKETHYESYQCNVLGHWAKKWWWLHLDFHWLVLIMWNLFHPS